MPATKIVIDIPGENPYDVRIGDGILEGVGPYCKKIEGLEGAPSVLVLSDSNVAPLYLEAAKGSLQDVGYKVSDIVVPAGEDAKSLSVASEVWEAMAQLSLTRDCFAVALGGGVVGDLTGFAASTYMRGIKFVQAPTTLLSMVDSSVGGKTGVNLSAGKNLVGTFMQPSYVCASIDTLSTLDDREWACGCAEIAKSSVIDSNDFFFWMLENADALWERDPEAVKGAIERSVVFKANVVVQDKTESKGVRECLNYGHTLAHAIEKLAGYGTYSHGATVAEGMRFAVFLGERIIGADSDFAASQAELLTSLGLPYLDWYADAHDIVEIMKTDKKSRGGKIRFVLVEDVAKWSLVEVDDDILCQALEDYFAFKRDIVDSGSM